MIVDSSAILAVLRDEPDASVYSDALSESPSLRMSAATFVEAAIVIAGDRDAVLSRRFDDLLARTGVVIEPFTPEQARIAREAHRDFGRGSGHPARLNFGDCFSYALAKSTGEPLLFKGNDFIHTDVTPAIPAP